jgi:hypothetical protein
MYGEPMKFIFYNFNIRARNGIQVQPTTYTIVNTQSQ